MNAASPHVLPDRGHREYRRGVTLHHVESTIEGDIDLHGMLGLRQIVAGERLSSMASLAVC